MKVPLLVTLMSSPSPTPVATSRGLTITAPKYMEASAAALTTPAAVRIVGFPIAARKRDCNARLRL